MRRLSSCKNSLGRKQTGGIFVEHREMREGYCLQRTRGRLTGLIWAILLAVGGGLAIWFFAVAETVPYEAERLK